LKDGVSRRNGQLMKRGTRCPLCANSGLSSPISITFIGALDLGHPECETDISNLSNPTREYDDTVQMHLFVMRDTAKLGERN